MIGLANIFGDHMVLQRQKPIQVWGTCTDETIIHGRLAGQEANAEIKDGAWKMIFSPQEACENITLEIWSDKEHFTFRDVAIGEVWIAGGQSNMQFYLRYDKERKEAVSNEKVRMFDYPKVSYEGQIDEFDYSEFGHWRVCQEENLDYFSAVAYYFALQLEEQYQIPIGIIGCNWGGTPACTWLEPNLLKNTAGEVWLEEYQNTVEKLDLTEYEKVFKKHPNYQGHPFEDKIAEKMMYGMSEQEWDEFLNDMFENMNPETCPGLGPKSEQRPGALYENMVKKIAPYTVRGVIWYQGENDESKASIYHIVFSKVIQSWRELWEEELPFLFVQLAPFGYWGDEGIFPLLRKNQEWVAEKIPNTWMTSIMDVGNKKDIHPKTKRPVGERLALLARGHIYGEKVECDSPVYAKMEVETGVLRLYFYHTAGSLYKKGDKIQALKVIIDGIEEENPVIGLNMDVLTIKSKRIREESKIQILFAETNYCEVNLYNRIDLPVKPFIAVANLEKGGKEVCCMQSDCVQNI